jgi:hypothetical protein
MGMPACEPFQIAKLGGGAMAIGPGHSVESCSSAVAQRAAR